MTQPQLAAKSGLTKSFVSKLEKGKVAASRQTVNRLASALGVHVMWLHRGEQPRDLGPAIPVLKELLESDRLVDDEKVVLAAILERVWKGNWGTLFGLDEDEAALVIAYRCVPAEARAVVMAALQNAYLAKYPKLPWPIDVETHRSRPAWWAMVDHVFEHYRIGEIAAAIEKRRAARAPDPSPSTTPEPTPEAPKPRRRAQRTTAAKKASQKRRGK